MRRFLALAFLVFSSCLSCAGIHVPSVQVAKVEIMAQETVALVTDADQAYCAGVWVGADKVITAYHCIEKDDESDPLGAKVNLRSKGGVTFEGQVAKTDANDDLALIEAVKHPAHLYAPVALIAFVGEDLHIIGHPGRKEWTYMHGWISSMRTNSSPTGDGDYDVWQISAPIYYGNSGGGAFNDSGELVGICSTMSTKMPNTGYFVRLSTIRKFLRA